MYLVTWKDEYTKIHVLFSSKHFEAEVRNHTSMKGDIIEINTDFVRERCHTLVEKVEKSGYMSDFGENKLRYFRNLPDDKPTKEEEKVFRELFMPYLLLE